MNKVRERCQKDSCAKFFFASQKMFSELKYIKLFMYVLNVVPVVICFLPTSDDLIKLICSCVSFALTLVNEVASALLNSYKEKAILEHQLYEAEITGSSFSKIEYDRESTNELNEHAIRKGLIRMRKSKAYPISNVPQEITDDYSYLYLCRISAAKIKYLVSRLFYFYMLSLIGIAVLFISLNFTQKTTGQTLYTLICIWPLIIPIIRNCTACKKCSRQCVKICADIDNFFADGDESVERLARFYYYVQNIEFEMMLSKPIIFTVFDKLFKRSVQTLIDGVTQRFEDAIVELKGRNLVLKGLISQPHGKGLITKAEFDMEYIEKVKKRKRNAKKAAEETNKTVDKKPVASAKPKTTKEPVKKTTEKVPVKKTTTKQESVKAAAASKTKKKSA